VLKRIDLQPQWFCGLRRRIRSVEHRPPIKREVHDFAVQDRLAAPSRNFPSLQSASMASSALSVISFQYHRDERRSMNSRGFSAPMDEQLRKGIRLFNYREFFQCHEVLEAAFMAKIIAGSIPAFTAALVSSR
jgi:hypothetical protein